LDDIHWETRLTTLSNCVMEVEKELEEKDMKSWVSSA
jgi:hypothetical protein